MCGIAGVISPVPLDEEMRAAVRAMNVAMGHRGPDDDGYFFDSHVALAMRRLSIIDVAGGHQPLHSADGTAVVVCNGEIYNYVELQKELAAQPYRFSSNSDVETILPLYQRTGRDCLRRLRGMYAMALWDRTGRKLLLARDRLGEKPLYLHQDSKGALWFASEMKALVAGLGSARFSLSAYSAYLFMVYQYVAEPRTMFEGICKLPAGTFLELSPEELRSTRIDAASGRPYWRYLDAAPRTGDPVPQVRAALEDAARITLRSDVPVGISLSGGIDSGLVAALARKFSDGELKAFSVGYPGRPQNDERDMAQKLARQLDMPFFDVELSPEAFVAEFPQLVYDMDDPVGDIAAYGYHAVSALAREHGVPVLLSGIGADELFWGYEWVRRAVEKSIEKRSRRTPAWLARLLGVEPDRAVFFDLLDWVRQSAPVAHDLLQGDAARTVPERAWTTFFEAADWGDIPLWLLDVHNRTWLASDCLALSDRMSMAHSVESRLPFLDFELTDLVTGLRKAGLDDWRRPHKWLLIEAIRDLLPAEVLLRPKRGFTPPVMDWMDAIVRTYSPLLEGGSLVRHGILDPRIAGVLPGRHPVGLAYRVVLLEIWARQFADGVGPSELRGMIKSDAVRTS